MVVVVVVVLDVVASLITTSTSSVDSTVLEFFKVVDVDFKADLEIDLVVVVVDGGTGFEPDSS